MRENAAPFFVVIGIAVVVILTLTVWIGRRKAHKTVPAQTEKVRAYTLTSEERQACFSVLEQTALPYLKLTAVRKPAGSVGLYDSKFGGAPYLPPGFAYPHNRNPKSDQKPLKLLAQLNFARLPSLPGFPKEGIL